MSNNKVRFPAVPGGSRRFSAFIQEQKPSIRKMRVVRLLVRFDRTRGEIYVKDKQALKNHLNYIIFGRELGGC